ncbi:hypothetical protein BKM32_06460 [Mangrovimonas sp. DI 80]|nr:hypothetical protein BKM32_06460 [Mangrovimonas sp. DI 80]
MPKPIALILLLAYVVALTSLSLVNIHKMPSLGSSFDDKLYHLGAYTVFMLLGFNFFRQTQVKHKILISGTIIVLYGIIIEVLQQTLSTTRTLDAYDMLANFIGVVVGTIIIKLMVNLKLN